MRTYVVGIYDLFDNCLTMVLVQAVGWREAICFHPMTPFVDESGVPELREVPTTLEAAKEAAFNYDRGLDVIELDVIESQVSQTS